MLMAYYIVLFELLELHLTLQSNCRKKLCLIRQVYSNVNIEGYVYMYFSKFDICENKGEDNSLIRENLIGQIFDQKRKN